MLWPVFVVEGQGERRLIDALPGQFCYGIDALSKDLDAVVADGVGGVLVFGNVGDECKNSKGSYAYRDDGLVQRAVSAVRARFTPPPPQDEENVRTFFVLLTKISLKCIKLRI